MNKELLAAAYHDELAARLNDDRWLAVYPDLSREVQALKDDELIDDECRLTPFGRAYYNTFRHNENE